MSKKFYSFLFLLTAFLWLGTGTAWGDPVEITPENPYTNSFDTETTNAVPTGWTKVAGNTYNPGIDSKNDWSGYTRNSSAKALFFMGNLATGDQIIALPQFSDDIKYLTVDFYYKTKSSSYPANMSVGYITNLSSKSTYVAKKTLSYSSDGWTHFNYTFDENTPDGAYIAISFAGTNSSSSKKGLLSVEDITVTTSYVAPTGSCAKPKNLTKSDDTPEGATFTWEQNADETTYQWACVTSGATVEEWATLAENVRTKTVTGLTAGTAYDFCVRSYCGSGESEQSELVKTTFTPECPAPTAPQVTDITTTTATLSWTAAAGISNYQYIVVARDAAEDWTSPTLVEGATTASLTSGLAAGTKYDVYVRSYYNATTVSASVKGQFATPCNAMAIADFDGTFETETAGSGLMPNCWDAAASYEYTDSWTSAKTTYPCVKETYSSKTGDKCLAFYGGSTPNIAVLPVFTEALNTLTISFYYKNGSTWGGYFSFGYYKNGVFTAYEGASNLERLTSYTQFELAIPNVAAAEGARLAIKYAGSSYNYDAYIDDITISFTPSCTKPSAPTVSNIVYNGATIDWTENGSAKEWKVQYSTNNTDWTTANGDENITAHPYDLRGLTSGTPYYVRVISVCGPTEESPAVAAASTFTPQCVTPGIPTIPAKTTTTATIQWTVNSGEAEWNLQYKKSSGDADWTTVTGVTENPYLLEGLTSGSTYQVRVAATCNGTYTSAATFDTECEAKSAPFDEDFNDLTALPACWNFAGSTSTMNVSTGSSWLSLENKALFFSGSGGAYAYAILPTMNVEWNTLQIAFSHREESGSGGNIELGYYASGAFTALTSYSNKGDNMQAETAYSLAAIPDGARAAFAYKPASSGYAAAVDDIHVSVYVAPSCADPTALAVSEIGTNSATVTWESEASEFALEYKKTADVNWTAATGTIASPFVLSGLEANETEYTVRVKAICGVGNESEWVELADPFKTDCENKTVTEESAWTENFESQESGKIPTCWSEVSTYASSAYTQVNASAAKDGSLGVQVYVYSTYTEIALLPIFETEIKNLKISFDYKNQGDGSNYAALEVGYYNDGAFTNVTTLDKTTSFAASGEIEMPKTAPEGARIAFRVVGKKSSYNGSAYIDNISVIRKPACAVPTITAADATSEGAVVTWTPGDEESQWNLRYSEKDADSWTVLENKTSGFAITSLTVGTIYEVQVQAYCDELHQSAWSASTEFEPICNAPSGLAVTARTQNSATFSWTSSESAWVLNYSADGENWESESVAVNPFTLTGLTAGQTYQAKIQAACGSAFSNVVSFTTWCDSKLSLPVEFTSFSAIPACWEVSPAGAVEVANSQLCFTGEGEKFLYLPQTSINLNLLSVTFTFSGSLEFGYIDEPNGTFHAFDPQPTSGVELDLAAEAEAAKYIAVRYNGASSLSTAAISAIAIRKTPTCLKPTGVAGTPSVGSASIDWTKGSSETAWNLQYKTGSADWTTVAVTEKPYELSGLEQGVSYKVRVQANCGEELSDWSDEASFTTNCASIEALPWFADFSQDLSNCWTIHAESSSSYYIPAANTAMNQLKMDGGKEGNSNNVVVLPAISADLSNAVLSLEYKNGATGASYAKLEIGYVTDKTDASTFALIGEAWEQSTSFTEARAALADVTTGRQVALRFAGANSISDLSIKNLRVINTVTFADTDVDNDTKIADKIGQTLDVVIGRTFTREGFDENPEHYSTLCLPFSLSAEEFAASPLKDGKLWAFKYAKVENEELLFRIIEADHIEAGVPYFIDFAAGSNIVSPLFKNVTIAASEGQNVGNEVAHLCGILEPETFVAGVQTKLFLYTQTNTLYWWNGSSNSQLYGFRAFFQVGSGSSSAPIYHGMPARIVKEEQETTGIDNTSVDNQARKVLENNQVVIIRNGVKYTIQGQKIQ